jgi:archaellum component FlaC
LVGPKTRAKLNEVSGGQTTQTQTQQITQLQNQISDLLKLVEELQKQLNSF